MNEISAFSNKIRSAYIENYASKKTFLYSKRKRAWTWMFVIVGDVSFLGSAVDTTNL